jgi:hypothetical protein
VDLSRWAVLTLSSEERPAGVHTKDASQVWWRSGRWTPAEAEEQAVLRTKGA